MGESIELSLITGLAKDWLPVLLHRWKLLRSNQSKELDSIRNTFCDPEILAHRYIEPDCQLVNPADFHEDDPIPTWSFRVPVRDWINRFTSGNILSRDGRNILFILSDAGIGKSSFLVMLKLTYMARFWPDSLKFVLLKLGPSTLNELQAIESRRNVVLLLDALDEDSNAFERVEMRIGELLREGTSFHRVIITCRTQFFPEGGDLPIEQPGKIEIMGYICNLIYLSPFSDDQVSAYLQKIYKDKLLERIKRWISKLASFDLEDNKRIKKAKSILSPMQSLKIRPMLLAYIEDLASFDLKEWREYAVYKSLITHWLLREERKSFKRGGPKKEDLWKACEVVAVALQKMGERNLSEIKLEQLLKEHPVVRNIRTIEISARSLLNKNSLGAYRFAHYSIQEFLVANAIINNDDLRKGQDIHMSDQILSFIYSWVAENPKNRWLKVWNFLKSKEIQAISADFRQVDFTGANQIFALLRNIKNKDFKGSIFTGLDLARLDFSKAYMRDVILRKTNLVEANFQRCILINADLEGCIADKCNLESSILTNANLKNSSLKQANLTFATLKNANLEGSNLTGTILDYSDLRGTNLIKSVGLEQKQIDMAYGDKFTSIPLNLIRPTSIPSQKF